ncbi:MAG: hypothetical protein V4447_01215 [Pseudomonadota bacterium]
MKTKLTTLVQIFFIATILALPMAAQAQAPDNKPGDASPDKRPPHEPPPQAYASCKDKKAGDVVQIVTPREEKISAACTASPKGLFARPERPPHGKEDANGKPPARN